MSLFKPEFRSGAEVVSLLPQPGEERNPLQKTLQFFRRLGVGSSEFAGPHSQIISNVRRYGGAADLEFLSDLTGRSTDQIRRDVNRLVEAGVLTVNKQA